MSYVEDAGGLRSTPNLPAGVTPLNRATEAKEPREPGTIEKPDLSGRWDGGFLGSWEVPAAALRLDNTVVNAFAPIKTFEPEEGYTPLTDIGGTKYEMDYLDAFIGSRSAAETDFIRSKIDGELTDQKTMSDSGMAGWLARMAAGAMDPLIFLPVGGQLAKVAGASRATRLAVAAGETAAVAGGSVAIQEGILQASQETRTAEESFFAVVGATLIGGVLGGAVGSLGRREIDALAEQAKRSLPADASDETRLWNEAIGGGGSVGAASVAGARGSGALKGALGAETALSFQDPLIRLQTSGFTEARNTVRDLAETPLTLAENSEGIATTIGGSVETQVKMAHAPLNDALVDLDSAFSRYFFGEDKRLAAMRAGVMRLTGRSTKMSYGEFKEAVYEAALSGDVHSIPEVQQAATSFRTSVWEPLKQRAIEVGLFTEDVKPIDDVGYVPRVYNTEMIAARRPEFIAILAKHFEARQADVMARLEDMDRRTGVDAGDSEIANLSKAEIRDIADQVADTIMGHSPERMLTPGDLVAGPRGPLKERVLRIPTQLIRDFVERDVEVLGRMYVRTMAADIGLMKKFGSTDLAEQIRKINDEANAKIAKFKEKGGKASEAARRKIDTERKAALRDISAIRDRIRGNYAIPKDPNGLIVRAGRVARNLNYLRLLGGMTLSAVSDLARPVMVHGLGTTLKTAWQPFTIGIKKYRMASRETKLAGTALDMTLDSRVMAIADVMDDYGRGSKFERGLSGATRRFGIVSLMAPWNATMKQFVGVIAQTRMLQSIEKVVAGTATKKEIGYLAAGGIDANMAERIAKQFEKTGTKEGEVWWAATEGWTDRQAVESFRAMLVRDVDRTIVSPGQDKPLWMSTELGKTIGQFKSFGLASAQRTLIAGLQQRDMAALNGALLMLALGGLSYKLKADFAGYEVSDDPKVWAVEAFDRSGLAGWLMDANNIAEKFSRGRVGLSAFTGQLASRYASRNLAGTLLGPTADFIQDAGTFTGQVFSAAYPDPSKPNEVPWSASDTHLARKMMPMQNLFYLRWLIDQAEQGANNAFGVPARKN